VLVRRARVTDRDALRPILEQWVRGRVSGRLLRAEVEEILRSVGAAEAWHAVAIGGPSVLGVMGLTVPQPDAAHYAQTARPGQVVNAFVDRPYEGRGIGSSLAAYVENRAIATGLTELLVRSGPRYEQSGWGFWSARYGEPVAIEHADRGNTAVWRTVL